MCSGKTKRKIRHSSGRCLALLPDWLGTTQVSSPVANGATQTACRPSCVQSWGQELIPKGHFIMSQADACQHKHNFYITLCCCRSDFVTQLCPVTLGWERDTSIVNHCFKNMWMWSWPLRPSKCSVFIAARVTSHGSLLSKQSLHVKIALVTVCQESS